MRARDIIEGLEKRTLLAATLSGTTLEIDGGDGNDVIRVTAGADTTTVSINGTDRSFDNSDFDAIQLRAGDGADDISISDDVGVSAAIYGEGGDDTIVGGAGDDTISPGAGNDTIDGGGGYNTLDYSDRSRALSVNMDHTISGPDNEVDYYAGNIEVLKTGAGNDSISVNSNGPDDIQVIDAGAGDDTVDFIRHYDGATVYGGDGNDDLLILNAGREGAYFGGDGNDNLRTYRSSDTGRDFHGGAGIDTVDYSPFNTGFLTLTIDDQPGDGIQEGSMYEPRDNVHTDVEIVIGSQLGDSMTGSDGAETLIGGNGDDSIDGLGGDDNLQGSGGNDTLRGGEGNDTLNGGDGSDMLEGQAGDNTIISDADDEVVPPITSPVVVTDPPNNPITDSPTDTDSPSDTDNPRDPETPTPTVDGSGGDEQTPDPTPTTATVSLNGGVLRIQGTDGDDQILVRPNAANANTIEVSLNGDVTLYDRTVIKKIQLRALAGNDHVDLHPVAILSRVYGGEGDDVIYGSKRNDRLVGEDGNDWICGCAGRDVIYGNAGDDKLFGAEGVDYIRAGEGTDIVRAGAGVDRILASFDVDDFRGNRGDKILAELA
jgi:Ca2+-binding RTX toxin-like protein